MNKIKMDVQIILLVITGVASMVLGVRAHIESKKPERDLQAKQKRFEDAQDTVRKKQDELIVLQAQYQQDLRRKTDTIEQLQHELPINSGNLLKEQQKALLQATGGSSFCCAVFSNFEANGFIWRLHKQGDYPVYDVDVRVVEVDKMDITPDNIASWSKVIHAGNFAKEGMKHMGSLFTPMDYVERKYNLFFSARNGEWSQQYVVRKKNDTFYHATKVRNSNGEFVYAKIMNGFLNDGETQFQWNNAPAGEYIIKQ